MAVEDPYLTALIGTIEEPAGSSTAAQAGRLTIAWWDTQLALGRRAPNS